MRQVAHVYQVSFIVLIPLFLGLGLSWDLNFIAMLCSVCQNYNLDTTTLILLIVTKNMVTLHCNSLPLSAIVQREEHRGCSECCLSSELTLISSGNRSELMCFSQTLRHNIYPEDLYSCFQVVILKPIKQFKLSRRPNL